MSIIKSGTEKAASSKKTSFLLIPAFGQAGEVFTAPCLGFKSLQMLSMELIQTWHLVHGSLAQVSALADRAQPSLLQEEMAPQSFSQSWELV